MGCWPEGPCGHCTDCIEEERRLEEDCRCEGCAHCRRRHLRRIEESCRSEMQAVFRGRSKLPVARLSRTSWWRRLLAWFAGPPVPHCPHCGRPTDVRPGSIPPMPAPDGSHCFWMDKCEARVKAESERRDWGSYLEAHERYLRGEISYDELKRHPYGMEPTYGGAITPPWE